MNKIHTSNHTSAPRSLPSMAARSRGTSCPVYTNRRAFSAAHPITVSLILIGSLAFNSCSSLSKSDGSSSGEKKKTEYKLSCSGDSAVRREIFDGSTLREGPVKLPAGTSCGKAAGRSDSQIKALAREGKWRLYFRGTRKLLGEGMYRNDKREGVWEFRSKDGGRSRTSTYANDEKNGPETNYFPGHGTWQSKGSYTNDKKEGPWQIKINASGSCISEGAYSADKKSGTWKECAVSKTGKGYLAYQGGYNQDVRDGAATLFHTNGNPLARGRLRADMTCAAEPPNGDLRRCSKRTGAWEIFHPNGKLAWQGGYDGQGKKSGTWTEFYQTGSKLAVGSRSAGRKSGTWKYYRKDGGLHGEYRFGRSEFLVSYAVLYENGRKIGAGPLKNALLKYDTAKDEIRLSNARKSGRWTEYHSSGAKAGEGEYSFGFKRGAWTHYDTSGRKIAEGNYSHNKKHGVWKELQGGAWKTIEYRLGKPK